MKNNLKQKIKENGLTFWEFGKLIYPNMPYKTNENKHTLTCKVGLMCKKIPPHLEQSCNVLGCKPSDIYEL